MKPFVLAAACAALLAACASTPPMPQPQALNIAPGVWRLSERAAWGPGAQVGVLRRAADLTLAEGGDWFRVVARERGSDGDGWGFGEGSSDVGDNLSDPGAYALATLEIEIGRGPKPDGRDVYDARQVAAGARGVRMVDRPRGDATPV